jgi:hypothetical protein
MTSWQNQISKDRIMSEEIEPHGIIAIMTDPDGDVIATSADFDRSGIGGCKLWEAQLLRTRDSVRWKAIRAYCTPHIADAISNYLAVQIADSLCKKGHKITFRAIGYSVEITEEVERR